MKNLFSKLLGREPEKQNVANLKSKTSPQIIRNQQAGENLVETETKENEIGLNDRLVEACKEGDVEKVNWIFNENPNSRKPDLTKITLPQRDGRIVPILNWVMNKLAFEDTKSEAYLSIAKILVVNGADFTWVSTNYESSPIESAVYYGYTDLFRLMIDKGVDVLNSEKCNGIDFMVSASEKGHYDIVKILIDSSIDINKPSKYNSSALKSAVQYNRIEIVKLLVSNGADVNRKDNGGETPIMVAAREGYKDIVVYLLNSGADPTIKDNKGQSAVNYASSYGQTDIVKIFLGDLESDLIQKLLLDIEDNLTILVNRKDYDPWDRDDNESKKIIQKLINGLTSLRLQENPKLLDKIKELFSSKSWVFDNLFSYIAWDNMGCKYKTTISIKNELNEIDSNYCTWLMNEIK